MNDPLIFQTTGPESKFWLELNSRLDSPAAPATVHFRGSGQEQQPEKQPHRAANSKTAVPAQPTMRRISRLRAPVPAGFCPSSLPTNTPVRASTVTATTSRSQTSSSSPRTFQTRPLTTTPIRTSQSQIQSSEELDFPEDYDTTNTPQLPASNLVYPRGITAAPAPAEVTDASYKPAETAEGLAEVGGLSGWWDEPSHWGSAEGPAAAVRAVLNTFGKNNAVEVEDKAVLEVIARRAVVEALAVKKFMEKEAGKVGAVDELFACNLEVGAEKLGEIVGTKVVAGKDGQATFGDSKEGQRVFGLLRDAVKVKRAEAKKTQKVQAEKGEEEEMKKGEAVVEEVKAQEAAPALTPEVAQEMIQSWDQGWRKAELRDPVVKFYVSSDFLAESILLEA